MLISDPRQIGNRLLAIRKHIGLTQAEVAEAAGLSDRAYADIERGSVNMRIDRELSAICLLYTAMPAPPGGFRRRWRLFVFAYFSAARKRKVTICARVQSLLGENVVADVPVVTPALTAH